MGAIIGAQRLNGESTSQISLQTAIDELEATLQANAKHPDRTGFLIGVLEQALTDVNFYKSELANLRKIDLDLRIQQATQNARQET